VAGGRRTRAPPAGRGAGGRRTPDRGVGRPVAVRERYGLGGPPRTPLACPPRPGRRVRPRRTASATRSGRRGVHWAV